MNIGTSAPKAGALPKIPRKMLKCLGLFFENSQNRVRECGVCASKKIQYQSTKFRLLILDKAKVITKKNK